MILPVYGMRVPVAMWQVRLRTAISIYFTILYFTTGLLKNEGLLLLSDASTYLTKDLRTEEACDNEQLFNWTNSVPI